MTGFDSRLIVLNLFYVSIPVAFIDPQVATRCWLALFFIPVAGRLGRNRRA